MKERANEPAHPVKAAGRPSCYSDSIAEAICTALEDDNLYRVCLREGMPARSTVLRWIDEHPDFATRCARAEKARAAMRAGKIEDLADSTNADNAQARKVQISTHQWLASKEDARYSDKFQAEVTGKDGGPIEAAITVQFVKPNGGNNS